MATKKPLALGKARPPVETVSTYPPVLDPTAVGSYEALAGSGGGYVWDEVLEYRVWCHAARGSDYYYAFATYAEALQFSKGARGAERPLALILQREYINEPDPGVLVHVKQPRITEWPVEFLTRPKRTADTIPSILAAAASASQRRP